MKNVLLTLLCAFGILTASAQNFDYLTFRTNAGMEYSLPVDGLKIVINGDKLQVSSTAQDLTFAIDELGCFFFATEPTAIQSATADDVQVSIVNGKLQTNAPVGTSIRVFTLDGREVPATGLGAGIYVIKINNRTFKTLAR